jgi:tetrahydromethanopterin S-methyltransferase subunit G
MAADTEKILQAIAKSSEGINERLDDHEQRLRNVETAITIQGLKVGALITLIMTVCGSVAGLIAHKIDVIVKWWSGQ